VRTDPIPALKGWAKFRPTLRVAVDIRDDLAGNTDVFSQIATDISQKTVAISQKTVAI